MAGRGPTSSLAVARNADHARIRPALTDEAGEPPRSSASRPTSSVFRDIVLKAEMSSRSSGQGQQAGKDRDPPGGALLIGSERHESRRLDNRCAAGPGAGDPGRSKFFLSPEDDLMRISDPPARHHAVPARPQEARRSSIPGSTGAGEGAAEVEARNFDILQESG